MANHIKARRKQLKLTQQAIADVIGTTKATVMKLEKGDMQLTEAWMRRLCGPLQCKPEDIIAERIPEDVPLIGEIGVHGVVQLYRDLPPIGAGEVHDYWQGLELVERPPETTYRDIRALRLGDEALDPFLSTGSIVYYAERVTGGFQDFEGKLVVCGMPDGEILLRRLAAGEEFNRYTLHCPQQESLSNVHISWLAKVIFLKPA